MEHDELTEWLFANSGPILRYRIAVDLLDLPDSESEILRRESLATSEVQRWLENLEKSRNIHGSKDTDAENALAKLLDYGFSSDLPAIYQKIHQFLNSPLKTWDSLVLLPFLLRAGASDHPLVLTWLKDRVEKLYRSAQGGSFDFYLSESEAAGVPKAWQGKPIYRDEFGHRAGYSLPTSYDFYALAYCPPIAAIPDLSEKRERIVAFLSDPRFQNTVGGYGWDREKRRCYAAGRVFLACVEPWRLVLFLELGAKFNAARQSEWFQQGLAKLESFRTPQGAYCFPRVLLTEKTGSHIYGGSHMGLGENRRSRRGLELESTFRMLNIYKRMGKLKV